MKSHKLFLCVLFLFVGISRVTADDGHGHHGHEEGAVHLSQESQQLGKIVTVPVDMQSLVEKIAVVGKVNQDPEHTQYIASDKESILEKCNAQIGSLVKSNDDLCTANSKDGQGIVIKSPSEGTIIAQLANPGEKISPVRPVFALADLSQVGVNFDIYEKDAGRIKLGQDVLIFAQAYSDKIFKGNVTFISPRMDETSNTLRIKVLAVNEGQMLKLGMNVRGEVLVVKSQDKGLAVPVKSIQTVESKTVVFIKSGPEEFQAKEVKVLGQTEEFAFVEGEICTDDQVVSEGSFILKSKMLESEMEEGHSH